MWIVETIHEHAVVQRRCPSEMPADPPSVNANRPSRGTDRVVVSGHGSRDGESPAAAARSGPKRKPTITPRFVSSTASPSSELLQRAWHDASDRTGECSPTRTTRHGGCRNSRAGKLNTSHACRGSVPRLCSSWLVDSFRLLLEERRLQMICALVTCRADAPALQRVNAMSGGMKTLILTGAMALVLAPIQARADGL